MRLNDICPGEIQRGVEGRAAVFITVVRAAAAPGHVTLRFHSES